MVDRFSLIHAATKKHYGKMTFNGKFIFTLDDNIDLSHWNRIGFIKLEKNHRTIESDNLFKHLNSRLPIPLRKRTNKEKIDYIKETGLRVVSDSFYLEPVV